MVYAACSVSTSGRARTDGASWRKSQPSAAPQPRLGRAASGGGAETWSFTDVFVPRAADQTWEEAGPGLGCVCRSRLQSCFLELAQAFCPTEQLGFVPGLWPWACSARNLKLELISFQGVQHNAILVFLQSVSLRKMRVGCKAGGWEGGGRSLQSWSHQPLGKKNFTGESRFRERLLGCRVVPWVGEHSCVASALEVGTLLPTGGREKALLGT